MDEEAREQDPELESGSIEDEDFDAVEIPPPGWLKIYREQGPALGSKPVEDEDFDDLDVPPWLDIRKLVEVSQYLAAAGLAGVVGNRADTAVQRMFRSVVDRWRDRGDEESAELKVEEAAAAARAAVSVAWNRPVEQFTVISAERSPDGSWHVCVLPPPELSADGPSRAKVSIPPGDPENASIEVVWRSGG